MVTPDLDVEGLPQQKSERCDLCDVHLSLHDEPQEMGYVSHLLFVVGVNEDTNLFCYAARATTRPALLHHQDLRVCPTTSL